MTGPDESDAGAPEQPSDDTADSPDEDGSWDVSLADLEREPDHIEPGSPSPEHVAFVLLGVVLTLAVIYRLVSLVGTTIA
jgi:hypothetical protein